MLLSPTPARARVFAIVVCLALVVLFLTTWFEDESASLVPADSERITTEAIRDEDQLESLRARLLPDRVSSRRDEASAESAAQPDAMIDVEVVDAVTGEAIPGIDVHVYEPQQSWPREESRNRQAYWKKVQRLGRRYTCDDEGRLRCPRPAAGGGLLAIDEHHYARARVHVAQTSYRLEARGLKRIAVRTVDEAGAALPGIEVALRFLHRHGDETDEPVSILDQFRDLTTAPDGRVELYHFPDDVEHAPSAALVAVAGTLDPPVEQPVDLDAASERETTLTVPAHGRILVEVAMEHGGAPPTEFFRISATPLDRIEDERQSRDGRYTARFFVVDGVGVLPMIGLGQELEVVLQGDRNSPYKTKLERIRGPERPGEDVAVRFVLPGTSERYTLIGRAVDAQGQVLSNLDLWAIGASSSVFRTDEEGRFRVIVDRPGSGSAEPWTVSFRPNSFGDLRCFTSVDLSSRAPGDCEIGDFVFGYDPILVSGRVVDEAGSPQSDVLVMIELGEEPEESRGSGHQYVPSMTTGQDGRFHFRRPIRTGSVVVRAFKQGYEMTRREAPCGSEDLEIQMKEKARLRFEIDTRSGSLDLSGLNLVFRAPGGEWLFTYTVQESPVDLLTDSGHYDFSIESKREGRDPFFVRKGLNLVSGETTDLGRIQISGEPQRLEMRVELEDHPVKRAAWVTLTVFRRGSDEVVHHDRLHLGEDPIVVFVDELPVDVEVRCATYRTTRFRDVTSPATLKLGHGISVTFDLEGFEKLPPGSYVRLRAQRDLSDRKWMTETSSPQSSEQPSQPMSFPEPGRYDIEVQVARPKNGGFQSASLGRGSKISIDVEDRPGQSFKIEVDPDLARRAFDSLTDD